MTASLGADCQACDDGTEACLSLRAEQIVGDYVEGATIEPITEVGDDCD